MNKPTPEHDIPPQSDEYREDPNPQQDRRGGVWGSLLAANVMFLPAWIIFLVGIAIIVYFVFFR